MSKTSSIISGLIIIALGIVLIICHKTIGSVGIVITAGVIFLIAGIIGLLLTRNDRPQLYDRDGHRVSGSRGMSRTFHIVTGVGAVILGLCMLIFQSTFATLIPFIFGCMVALGALIQAYILAVGVRPVSLSAWFYLVPVALAGASAYIFTLTTENDAVIMLVTGISLATFGVAAFVESLLVGHALRTVHTPGAPQTGAQPAANQQQSIKTLD